jgi:hypothetical protein
MDQDNTKDGVGHFTQDMEFSLLCRKNQEPDLPLSKDPKIGITSNVLLEVKLMRLTLNDVDNKIIHDGISNLPKQTTEIPAASSQKSPVKVTPSETSVKTSPQRHLPGLLKRISKSQKKKPSRSAPSLGDITNQL